MKSNLLFMAGAIIVGILTMFSCQNEVSKRGVPDDQVIEFLVDNGYHEEGIFIDDNFVNYDDAGWFKDDLIKTMNGDHDVEEEPDEDVLELRQRGIPSYLRNDAVSKNNVRDIKYYVSSSINEVNGDWYKGIREAKDHINGIANCMVRFSSTYSKSQADIYIGSDNESNMPSSHQNISSDGKAGFPSGGKVFGYISINDNYSRTGIKGTMVHEMLHCLGMRHTGSGDGEHIEGTSHNESRSVMNTHGLWATMSPGDKKALRMYYPTNLSTPHINSVSPSYPNGISINGKNWDKNNKPYFWIKIYYYRSNGSYIKSEYVKCNANNDGNFTVKASYIPGDAHQVAIKGYNLRRDIYSGKSGRKNI